METVKVDPNDFAVAMYSRLSQARRNLFFSPFSIRTALAIAFAGARGETAEEMHRALRFAANDEELHSVLAGMIRRLTTPAQGEYEMVVANSLWCQEGIALLPAFMEQVARHYRGCLNMVDFRRDAESAGDAVNRWVEEQTRRRIRELIPPGSLDPLTRLVIVNAVYLNGTWELEFDKEDTQPQPFHLESRAKVTAPLMHQVARVYYMRGPGFQAVDLAYRHSDVSMLVLLPDRIDGLADLESELSARLLHDCSNVLESRRVKLFLPRFRMTWGAELAGHLRALGMPKALTAFQADFSGIDGLQPPAQDSLFISSVFHKAFVEVDERGTEAAAATAFEMALASEGGTFPERPVPTFRADHPFLFAIRDRKSGALLFLGRVTNPLQED